MIFHLSDCQRSKSLVTLLQRAWAKNALLVNLYGEKFRNTKITKAYTFFDPIMPLLGTYKSKIMHKGGY